MNQLTLLEAPSPSAVAGRDDATLAWLDEGPPVVWTEEEAIIVHLRLLDDIACIASDTTSFANKIEILRWIFTDPELDEAPFSFKRCVDIASLSSLSPHPYVGRVDVEELRDKVRLELRKWLRTGLENYPLWVQLEIHDHPEWVTRNASKDPRWIARQIKKVHDTGDLFV